MYYGYRNELVVLGSMLIFASIRAEAKVTEANSNSGDEIEKLETSIEEQLRFVKSLERMILHGISPNDPEIEAMKRVNQTIMKEFAEIKITPKTGLNKIANSKAWQFLKNLYSFSDHWIELSQRILVEKADQDEIKVFRSLCKSFGNDPRRFIKEMNHSLVASCQNENEDRFREGLNRLIDNQLPFSIRSRLAYIYSIKQEVTMELLLKNFYSAYGLLKEKKAMSEEDKMIQATKHSWQTGPEFEGDCILGLTWAQGGCNHAGLASLLKAIENASHSLKWAHVICAALSRDDDEESRESNVRRVANNLIEIKGFANDYHKQRMQPGRTSCDYAMIANVVNELPPKKIHPINYQKLGEDIIGNLSAQGDRNKLRTVVVMPYLQDMNRRFFASCPGDRHLFRANKEGDVQIFYYVNQIDERRIEAQRRFMESMNETIREVFDVIFSDLNTEDQLLDIRNELIKRNLSFTGDDRFSCEVWTRQWTNYGDCLNSLPNLVITSHPPAKYDQFTYYYRHKLSLSACELYKIYVIP